MHFKSIAIDGPSGAGKSSVSKALSGKIGYIYVDTGALYRAVALFMVKNNISLLDEFEVDKGLNDIAINLKYVNDEQRIILNNNDITDEIRTDDISMAASNVSAFKSVRDFLLGLQKEIADNNNVVMDGRDIATVVLPNADLKIFLTASNEIRAQRRYRQLLHNGNYNVNYNDVLADIIERDKNDSNRDIAPLKVDKNAIVVDSSNMDFNQTLSVLYSLVEDKLIK